MELLQYTASLPGGSGQWISYNTLPHRLGAVGSGTLAMRGPPSWGDKESCPGGGRCLKSGTPAMHCHCQKSRPPAMHCHTAWGSGQRNACHALPRCLGAVGSATPAIHCLAAWGQWAVQLLQCTATPPGGDVQWNLCNARAHQLGGRGVPPRERSLPKERTSFNALPHCVGAVGSGTHVMHYLAAWAQWAVQLLQYTALLPGGSG